MGRVTTVPLLVISGPVGVGKTTVDDEVSALLGRRSISHTLLDMDVLAETYPRPNDDRFNKELALRNLRDIWRNCRAAGSRNLIIPRVFESLDDMDGLHSAIPNASMTLCQLTASDNTLLRRVQRREIGSGRAWHQARSLGLARLLKKAPGNFVIGTDRRRPEKIAEEIVGKVEWAS